MIRNPSILQQKLLAPTLALLQVLDLVLLLVPDLVLDLVQLPVPDQVPDLVQLLVVALARLRVVLLALVPVALPAQALVPPRALLRALTLARRPVPR
jgi:hypothetical protein